MQQHRWFLRVALFSLPLPWIAAELGWIVAEYGRQPWAIDGLLPTFLGVSATSETNVLLSLSGFAIFYSALAVVDVFLLVRMIRRGPDGLGFWPPQASRARCTLRGGRRHARLRNTALHLVADPRDAAHRLRCHGRLRSGSGGHVSLRSVAPTRSGARCLESVEPVWEGNQVWFILAGGAVFAAWPLLYAASFSGLYLAMFVLLVALILRPVGFMFRNQLPDAALAQRLGLGPHHRRDRARAAVRRGFRQSLPRPAVSTSTRSSDRCSWAASFPCCTRLRCSWAW